MSEQQQTTIEMVDGLSEIADYMKDEELTAALPSLLRSLLSQIFHLMWQQ
jgi:hypothetical protein